MNRKIVWAVACAVLMTGGCASSSKAGSGASVTSSKPVAPAKYRPAPGADAAEIAGHLRGCTGPTAGNVKGGGPDLVSTATCTLEGHVVVIDSFMSAAALDDMPELSKGTEIYYASGRSGWLAFLADQGATADTTTLQEQLTGQAGTVFMEATNGDPFPPAPLVAQKALATSIAGQLGGTVGHVS